VDFIEQGGNTLDFVEYDRNIGRYGLEFQGEETRVGSEGMVPSLIEQIDDMSVREAMTYPCALSDAPKAEQKKRAFGRNGDSVVGPIGHDAVILPCKVTAYVSERRPKNVGSVDDGGAGRSQETRKPGKQELLRMSVVHQI
jgi:hypothetical protein